MLAELFRERGFEGASLAEISARTGLGKGSLYHFFPGGKDEMARAVLAHIEMWFESKIFRPLETAEDPDDGLEAMFEEVERYFCAGHRICLVGLFALSDSRDRFEQSVRRYFERWRSVLVRALRRSGHASRDAWERAEEIMATVQGALVLARAVDDPGVFTRALGALRRHMLTPARP